MISGIGLMLTLYDSLILVGLVLLVIGVVFGIPLTMTAYRRWQKVLGIYVGVVVDDRGVDAYGEFVSWDEIREVREDPDEGYILVYRPDNDEKEPLCFVNLDHFPHFDQFLEELRTHGVEIKISHY
jgi:hypothetical protein